MRIDFFETNNGMDTRAVGAGVYMIELENRITKNKVCLYIGCLLYTSDAADD